MPSERPFALPDPGPRHAQAPPRHPLPCPRRPRHRGAFGQLASLARPPGQRLQPTPRRGPAARAGAPRRRATPAEGGEKNPNTEGTPPRGARAPPPPPVGGVGVFVRPPPHPAGGPARRPPPNFPRRTDVKTN